MKNSKVVFCLLIIIIIFLGAICVLFATGKIVVNNKISDKEISEDSKKETNNTSTETNQVQEESKSDTDYSGTYKSSDSSEVVITKEGNSYNVVISIYKLTTIEDGIIDDIKGNVLYISATDASGKPIEFTFNYKTKVLTVTETTWELLNVGDTFEFND